MSEEFINPSLNSILLPNQNKDKVDVKAVAIKSLKPKFRLSREKVKALSEFSMDMDIAKILFTSAVVGFFIPGSSGQVTSLTFILGFIASLFFLSLGILILPSDKNPLSKLNILYEVS